MSGDHGVWWKWYVWSAEEARDIVRSLAYLDFVSETY